MSDGSKFTRDELLEMLKETEEDIDEAEREASMSSAMDVLAGERRLRLIRAELAALDAREAEAGAKEAGKSKK